MSLYCGLWAGSAFITIKILPEIGLIWRIMKNKTKTQKLISIIQLFTLYLLLAAFKEMLSDPQVSS